MKKEDIRALYTEYDRQAKEDANDIAKLREYAKGILKPEVYTK